ncbi:hypothetical protein Tco_0027515 [Tanacetum coccineum]
MVYSGEGQQVFVSHAWRRLFEIRAPLVREFILEFLGTCRMSDTKMGLDVADTLCFQLGGVRRRMTDRLIPDKGDLRDYWMEISSDRDFLGPAPSYVLIQDPVRRLCHMMITYSISGRGHAEGRKSGARLSGGHFIRRLTMHFRFVSYEGLRGLQVVTRELSLIILHELGRLNICTRYGDTWAWVAQGPERQPDDAAGAYWAAEDAPAVDDDMSQAVPSPPRTQGERIARLEEEVHGMRELLQGQSEVLDHMARDFSKFAMWTVTSLARMMDRAGLAYTSYSETPSEYQRCTR